MSDQIILLFGPPGAGKGTQGALLAEALGLPHLSTGDMLRAEMVKPTERGRIVKELMDANSFAPDEMILGIIADLLGEPEYAQGAIFDGFPRTLVQAEALEELLDTLGRVRPYMIEFELDDDEAAVRMLGRGRYDDTEPVIAKRLADYHAKTEPMRALYESRGRIVSVDATASVEDVFERTLIAAERGQRKALLATLTRLGQEIENAAVTAYVEISDEDGSFYATCGECGWDGIGYRDRASAQADANEHSCAVETSRLRSELAQLQLNASPVGPDVLAAVGYCHLGSSRVPRSFPDAAIYTAERLGLLKHHPTWHATREGIGALIAAGMVEGHPAAEVSIVHVLWASIGSEPVNFVAAFPDGLVDAWPDSYARERAQAEERWRDWLPPNERVEFFTTVVEIERGSL